MEVEILNGWIQNLDADDREQRTSYKDMLQSRREMLLSLQHQKSELAASKQRRTSSKSPGP
jgi:hypothetical protein